MGKVTIGPGAFLYPMPIMLVGANVGGRPNYLTVACWCVVNRDPPIILVALNKNRYTNIGIKGNGTFSVNIPCVKMVKITDYCGIVSGHEVDKSHLFKTFYGKLETAPMIEECPLNLECKLHQIIEFQTNAAFIGEIIEVYSEDRYLTNGFPDIKKIDPIIFSRHENIYWKMGENLAQAYNVGKNLKSNSR